MSEQIDSKDKPRGLRRRDFSRLSFWLSGGLVTGCVLAPWLMLSLISWPLPGTTLPLLALGAACINLAAGTVLLIYLHRQRTLVRRTQEMLARLRLRLREKRRRRRRETHEQTGFLRAELQKLRHHLQHTDALLGATDADLNRAAAVQIALQSGFPSFAHCRIETLFEPLDAISGDLFHICRHGDACRIFVGDAMGHGVAAALVTGLAQACLAHGAHEHSEHRVLTDLDRLIQHCGLDTFMTGLMLTLAPSGHVRLAMTGAQPPLWWQPATGRAETLHRPAAPLGLGMTAAGIELQQFQLDPYDRLLLYTDGLVEWKTLDLASVGTNTLRQAAQEHAQRPLQHWLHETFDTIRNHSTGQGRRDDVTALALEYIPPPRDSAPQATAS